MHIQPEKPACSCRGADVPYPSRRGPKRTGAGRIITELEIIMNQWLNRLRYRFANFMYGRYGSDALSRFMSAAVLVFLILSWITRLRLLNTVALVLLVLIYMRMFSKNIQARYKENQKFLAVKNRIARAFGDPKNTFSKSGFDRIREKWSRSVAEHKAYHIYRCPACGQKIRIPRGKGHIMVTCPKCRREFAKNS